LSPNSGVVSGEWMVAIEIRSESARGRPRREPLVELASRIEKEWLTPTARDVRHELDSSGIVRAYERELYDTLTLREREVEPDPGRAAALMRDAVLERARSDAPLQELLRRAAFAGVELDLAALAAEAAARNRTRIELPRNVRESIDRLAPELLQVPSGRKVKLDYRDEGSIVASVKLQELFGLDETPRIGKARVPVTFALLSPAGRPVQTTRDLRSFWETTYPDVRKDLRARYPKHPWPEDPWAATPTAKAKKKR
ncbi:MAG TPA: ATP-dependent helicase C-terminal domain-containing protein, partial [Thermoanaerobaculia bacterium]